MTRRAGFWLMVVAASLLAGGCAADEASAQGRSTGKTSAEQRAGAAGAAKNAATVQVDLRWPTPNTAFARGEPESAYIQPTVSGEVRSGLFGSVRSGGRQFHEGLDLFPIGRDARGEATDAVTAALSGIVRHIEPRPSASNYGRYVVLEHPEQSPPVYTLYAHLAAIAPGLAPGQTVAVGGRLGTMGRSAAGTPIPKERAHLHFEIGVRLTDDFQAWYRRQGFGSPNEQGLWNGMNLLGLDPLEFFEHARAGKLRSLDAVFASQPVAVTMRVARATTPDFLRRYPSLVADAGAMGGVRAGWEISLNVVGVPVRWRALGASELVGWRAGEMRVIEVDEALLRANRGRQLVKMQAGRRVVDSDLATLLGQLFSESSTGARSSHGGKTRR
jgi:peptidoglycan LD-endopeptidase LytH